MAGLLARMEILALAELADDEGELIAHQLPRRDLRRQRVIRDRSFAFEMDDYRFKRLFRVNKEIAYHLCDRLGDRLSGNHVLGIPVDTKILIALRFFAVGCYQLAIGQDKFLTVSQATVSRCVKAVSMAISDIIMPEEIVFPTTDKQEMDVKIGFHEIAGFPGIIGAIDGTHIAIIAPSSQDEEYKEYLYVNRKGFHSLNVQVICDKNMRFLNVNAKFPGSAHDSHVFKTSKVAVHLENSYANGRRNSWLIGDSGYALRPWMMTPILNAVEGSPEEKYTKALTKTRNIVECCIGVLKQVFRCLLGHRTLHYHPTAAGRIIQACCTLHNLRRRKNHQPEDDEFTTTEDEDSGHEDDERTRERIRARRQRIRQRRMDRQFVPVPPYIPAEGARVNHFLVQGALVQSQIVARFRH